MKFAYKHILSNVLQNLNTNDLSEKLFQLGHEHEFNDEIIDVELTPNRGDCLSLNGILRDLNLFYNIKSNHSIYKEDIKKLDFNFTNKAVSDCPRVSFLKIEIENPTEDYNKELESYFSDLGVKKNNFFTDISNYVSYETGQPTHCYEASEVCDGLTLDYFEGEEKFETLLGKTIELNDRNLVFLNKKNEIVNLAGIVGSMSTSCKKTTKSVIVECAYFNPEAIIGKSVKYALNSEAAHKFERNVDPACHEFTLRRFIKIVEEHATIKKLEALFIEHIPLKKNIIELSINKINEILGTDLSQIDCNNYLNLLGFVCEDNFIEVPSYRHDINSHNDLAEEIARAIGYDSIKSKNFEISLNKNQSNNYGEEVKIKNLLVDNGFSEVINDPFVPFGVESSIKVDNPLDSNRQFLRTNLKNSLLENLLYNERRQKDIIKIFEIGDIYTSSSNQSNRFIGIIVSGRVDKNYKDFNKKLDKEYLSNILNTYIDDKVALNYEIISREGLDSKSQNVITYLELDINSLKINYQTTIAKKNNFDVNYTPVSDYPSSTRDLSFSVTDFSKFDKLQSYILSYEHKFLKEVFIFDYFYSDKRNEIKIGFRFIFQSNQKTLEDQEINELLKIIINHTTSMGGIKIPGIE